MSGSPSVKFNVRVGGLPNVVYDGRVGGPSNVVFDGRVGDNTGTDAQYREASSIDAAPKAQCGVMVRLFVFSLGLFCSDSDPLIYKHSLHIISRVFYNIFTKQHSLKL